MENVRVFRFSFNTEIARDSACDINNIFSVLVENEIAIFCILVRNVLLSCRNYNKFNANAFYEQFFSKKAMKLRLNDVNRAKTNNNARL